MSGELEMTEEKKCAIISLNITPYELDNFANGLSNLARYLNYDLIITNSDVTTINKEDLKRMLHDQ